MSIGEKHWRNRILFYRTHHAQCKYAWWIAADFNVYYLKVCTIFSKESQRNRKLKNLTFEKFNDLFYEVFSPQMFHFFVLTPLMALQNPFSHLNWQVFAPSHILFLKHTIPSDIFFSSSFDKNVVLCSLSLELACFLHLRCFSRYFAVLKSNFFTLARVILSLLLNSLSLKPANLGSLHTLILTRVWSVDDLWSFRTLVCSFSGLSYLFLSFALLLLLSLFVSNCFTRRKKV